ncbi:hypothetical protein PIB30_027398 [Stylosanthes scabra]|uniref:Cyclin-dependent kinase inhibitor domain-containing protein n=1 Tax=Stylosanthes scabra TaxID=79078 RepID=A0ABU6V9Q9_9FABA|nr:hypothetical protein [Stylosanthes scabra]
MSDCKRCVPLPSAMEAASSSPPSTEDNVSKKRKTTTTSCKILLTSTSERLPISAYSLAAAASFNDVVTVSPEGSVNSDGTVVSSAFCSDRSPRSCCSSTFEVAKELDTTPLDLEVQTRKGLATVLDSTFHNFKSNSLLSEQCGDSEESTAVAREHQRKSTVAKKEMEPEAEIEEFFAMAEKYEQKRFAEKYNFDIVADMPLEGRYQWVRLH